MKIELTPDQMDEITVESLKRSILSQVDLQKSLPDPDHWDIVMNLYFAMEHFYGDQAARQWMMDNSLEEYFQ